MLMGSEWLTVIQVLVLAVYVAVPVTVVVFVGLRLWRDRKAQILGMLTIVTAVATCFLVGVYDPGVGYTAPWYFDDLFRGGSFSNSLRTGNSLGDDGVHRFGVTVTVTAWASAILFAATIALLALTVTRWARALHVSSAARP